ncbi:MAG: hypothetical protein AB7F50_11365 [Fimbriimonadaceae bacterium]
MDYFAHLFRGARFDPGGPDDSNKGKPKSRLELHELRRDLDRLALAVQAIWELTSKAHGLQPEDLSKQMYEIDLRDGKLDGKSKSQKRMACPQCGKVLQRNTPKCIYCGQEVFLEPF